MELYHKDKFYDVQDVVIPGTEERRGCTEENEQVVKWMKESGRIPLTYQRERDGIHVEISKIFEAKIKDVLQRGTAIGADGRKFTIENPDNLIHICGSVCVRATPEGGTSDAYALDFFV